MPPRIRVLVPKPSPAPRASKDVFVCWRCQYATAAAATSITQPPSISHMTSPIPPTKKYPPSQPPSHRPPEFRKSQLLRSYVSLLQTTPLILLFQHNNLKSTEWVSIRRELAQALRKVDDSLPPTSADAGTSSAIKLQIIRSNIFEPSLRVAEYFQPVHPGSSAIASTPAHALSEAAYQAALAHKGEHPLTPLLAGPVALLTFPTVSPAHLKAALQVLCPQPPSFPAPTRRGNPGYWDTTVQEGLRKLMLLGARVEGGRVLDADGTRGVGLIDGGIDALRAQLVHILQGVGAGLTGLLESSGRAIYLTVESRRRGLLDEQQEQQQQQQQQEKGESGTGETPKEI